MPDGAGYDQDFFLWTRQQAERMRETLRRGSNADIDWENVAEEIESLGKSDRRQVRSRLAVIIEHLLKLRFSIAAGPRPGWVETVMRERVDVDAVLEDSPSLRRLLPGLARQAGETARELASLSLERHGEASAAALVQATDIAEFVDRVLDRGFLPEGLDPPSAASA